jgi:L-iditol 2-dehydrogenase
MVRRMNEVYPRAIDLAARGVVALDPLVSSRTPLTDAAQAFAAAEGRVGLKTIIAPWLFPHADGVLQGALS